MSRFENKYLIPIRNLQEVRNFFAPYVEIDNFSAQFTNNYYTVRSIYFDTANLKFYHEKADGLRIRKKLRIRGYNSTETGTESVVFLEIKRKNASIVSKNRSPVYFKNMPILMATNDIEFYVGALNNKTGALTDARKFFYYIQKNSLIPVIKIIYEREAFFYKFNQSLRLTFDLNLRSSLQCDPEMLYCEDNIVYSLPRHFILEIKGQGNYPGWLKFLISKLELKQQAICKYTTCIDSHRKFGQPLFHLIRTKYYNQIYSPNQIKQERSQ